MRKLSVALICLIILCMFSPLQIIAAENDLSEENTIALNYYISDENMPLANASFSIYLAAEPDSSGGYALCGQFSDYQVDMSELDWNEAGRLTTLAVTLSAYADRDHIAPLKSGTTDENGMLTFTDLPNGLYLIKGDIVSVNIGGDEWNYMAQPLLLPMPYPVEGGSGISDMEVDVKYDRIPPPSTNEFARLTVIKVWHGGKEHPDSVTAQLLCDGAVVDSVELNEENNWRYVWEDLNVGHVWQIVEEKVPEGYKVSVKREKYLFTITNSDDEALGGEEYPTETATTSDEAAMTTAAESSEHGTTYITNNSTTTAVSGETTSVTTETITKLPQTGQLWWPVPICMGAGLLLIGIGIIIRVDDKE